MSIQFYRNVRSKGDPVVPNTVLKPAPSSAILLTSISFAFNFALAESALPLFEGCNLRKYLITLSQLLSEVIWLEVFHVELMILS